MRRCPTLVAVLAAGAVVCLGLRPTPLHADTISFTLSTSTGLSTPAADISEPQVVATVASPGEIVPPTLADGSQGSPLTILSDSKGFDPSQLVVALKDDKNASGVNEQQFGLVFYGTGLAANGILHFSLNVNSVLASDPSLLHLTTPSTGFTLTADKPTGSGGTTSTGGSTDNGSPQNVPEPFSIIVWSALAGTGLIRVRAARRGVLTPQATAV